MTDQTSILRLPLTPYFHPTTVVFIDDNESFLTSLDLELPLGWAYRCFTDPLEAFEFLQQPPSIKPLIERCFSVEHSDRLAPTVHLNLGTIEQEVNHVERFERISVVIVDYAMPTLNGLDFCAKMSDPYVRKALLTGVADEKVAVEAFNAGIIHKFIQKNTVLAVNNLLKFVGDLQVEYFHQYLAQLNATLALHPPGFLLNPAVQEHVLGVMRELHIVEYYLVNDPPGFLLGRADGSMFRLIVTDDASLAGDQRTLEQHEAPPAIRRKLARREGVPYFTESPEDYLGHEPYPWHDNFVPAARVANTEWYVGVMEDPPLDIDFDPGRSSYDAYLANL